MNELAYQARFSYPRFAHNRHHLAASVTGMLAHAAQLLQFDVAADKARQTTLGGHLKASSSGGGTRQLVYLYRLSEPLHRTGTKGLHGDVAFRQSEGRGACNRATRLRHLLQPRRQIRGLAYDGVVHVQVVADATDDDLPRVQSDSD